MTIAPTIPEGAYPQFREYGQAGIAPKRIRISRIRSIVPSVIAALQLKQSGRLDNAWLGRRFPPLFLPTNSASSVVAVRLSRWWPGSSFYRAFRKRLTSNVFCGAFSRTGPPSAAHMDCGTFTRHSRFKGHVPFVKIVCARRNSNRRSIGFGTNRRARRCSVSAC